MRREELRQAARDWAAKGHIDAEGLAAIEAELGQEEPSTQSALFGLGGALLGAAVVALVILAEIPDDGAAWALSLAGLVGIAAGLGLRYATGQHGLADALLVAGLVDLTTGGGFALDGPEAVQRLFPLLAMAAGAGLVWLAGRRGLVPLAGTVAFFVAAPMALFGNLEDVADAESLSASLYLLVAVVYTAFVAVLGRIQARPWCGDVLALCAVALAAALLWFSFEVVEPDFRGGHETVVGLGLLLVLGAGLAAREPGLVIGAGPLLAIDAIVFAFDVGDVVGGVITLLLMSGLMIGLGVTRGRRLRQAFTRGRGLPPRGPP